MTIIAIWLNQEEEKKPCLWAVSDSLLSQSEKPIFEHAAKLHSIRVTCLKSGKSGFPTDIYFSTRIGLSFSGSSLVPSNLVSFLHYSLGSLVNNDQAKPSLRDIADHVKFIFEKFLTDYYVDKLNESSPSFVQVFGFCPINNRYELFGIRPKFTGKINVECEDFTGHIFESEYVFLAGSKIEEIKNKINHVRRSKGKDLNWWRAPKEIIEEIIQSENYSSIGGSLQLGIVHDHYGFQLYQPIKPGQPEVNFTFQGINYLNQDNPPNIDILRVGSCLVHIPGMV